MSDFLAAKEQNAIEYVKKAIHHFKEKQFNDGVAQSRIVAEAFCKGIIAQDFKEEEVTEILTGDPKRKIRTLRGNGPLQLNEMINYLVHKKDEKYREVITKLRDIQLKGRNTHHDPNEAQNINSENDVHLIMHTLIDLLNSWRLFFTTPTPTIFAPLVKSLDFSDIKKETQDEWEIFYDHTGSLNRLNNYVLVLPPDNMGLTKSQMMVLMRIHWKIIFDFNSASKDTGFFSILENPKSNNVIRPITIEQRDDASLLNIDRYSINWIFANGITTIPETVPKSVKEWKISLKYPKLLEKVTHELHTLVNNFTVVIFLYNDQIFINDIFEKFTSTFQEDRIKLIFICESKDVADELSISYKWYEPLVLEMSINKFVEGIANTMSKNIDSSSEIVKLIPSRAKDLKDDNVDVSNRYFYYLSEGLELLYQRIGLENEDRSDNKPFYTGNTISWFELSIDGDVRRNVLEKLQLKLTEALQQAKGAKRINLVHKPGAGGTTLSRRIAYNFHNNYPTIILLKYVRGRTIISINEIAEFTQKSIILIVEAFRINENDIEYFMREINNNKKNVVILYVKRDQQRERNILNGDLINLSDKMIDITEMSRFISKYSMLANDQGRQKLSGFKDEPLTRYDVIDYPLITFENAVKGEMLFNYIYSNIEPLWISETKFLVYLSIIYNYTQKSVNENWFKKIFGEKVLSERIDYNRRVDNPITKLIFQESDVEGFPTEYWRPKYNLFAKEILNILMGGRESYSVKESWKDNLHVRLIDMIDDFHDSDPILTKEVRELLKSLLLERDNSDTIVSIDAEIELQSHSNQFSKIISDISDKINQKAVFVKLVSCYPNEAHYLGHLGRFLYEKAETYDEFEEAYNYITSALSLAENDFNLWHIHGMCNKTKIDYLIRQFDMNESEFVDIHNIQGRIQEFADSAQRSFVKSREINQLNFHSHVTEILAILKVLDFGKRSSKVENIVDFLTRPEFEWYQMKFESLNELITQTRELITLSRDLENKASLLKSRDMLNQCETKLLTFLEQFTQAAEKIYNLISSAGRDSRPYFRKLYLLARLSNKSKVHNVSINDAWQHLSEHELQIILTNIENNIREAPSDERNYRDWLSAIRHHPKQYYIDDAIIKLRSWRDITPSFSLGFYQASYYLYVLHSINALNKSSDMSNIDANSAIQYKKDCITPLISDTFSFEWFGVGVGIKQMINFAKLGKMNGPDGFFSDTSRLKRVKGVILRIQSPQSGVLKLNGGLEAFFVPTIGRFTQHHDETTEVDCYIGFRYGMIHAWQVRRINEVYDQTENEVVVEIKSLEKETETLPSLVNNISSEAQNIPKKYKYIEPFKVFGKMDIDDVNEQKKKKK